MTVDALPPAAPPRLLPPRLAARVAPAAFLLAATALMIGPFVWMVSTSLKPPEEFGSPSLIPSRPTLEHFGRLFEEMAFARSLLNSIIVTLSVTAISLFLNALAGYAFAKFEFPLKRWIFAALIITLMIPLQVTMLPSFLILKEAGLLNTRLGLILPGASSVFGIFLMRQFLYSIPDAYLESARIDGCGEFRIFVQIVLPQCQPVLAALGIFTFMGAWQDFLFPLIILHDERMYTLPVALANLNGQHATDWGMLMAGSLVVIAPIAAVFLAMQRRFVEGVTLSGIK